MGSSSSILRKQQALRFLLFKTISGFEDVFIKVESKIQIGDILLFPIETSCGRLIRSFKHAAVYCGEGEVIHFQNTDDQRSSGLVSKEGYKAVENRKGKFEVYRKKGGINLEDFHSKVKEAMNSKAKYHVGRNNCIHFALFLLGLADIYMQLVEVKNEDSSDGAATCSPPTLASQKSNHMV